MIRKPFQKYRVKNDETAVICGHVQREILLDDLCRWAVASFSLGSWALDDDDAEDIRDILAEASTRSLMHPLAVKAMLEKSGYSHDPGAPSCSAIVTAHKRTVTHHKDLFQEAA